MYEPFCIHELSQRCTFWSMMCCLPQLRKDTAKWEFSKGTWGNSHMKKILSSVQGQMQKEYGTVAWNDKQAGEGGLGALLSMSPDRRTKRQLMGHLEAAKSKLMKRTISSQFDCQRKPMRIRALKDCLGTGHLLGKGECPELEQSMLQTLGGDFTHFLRKQRVSGRAREMDYPTSVLCSAYISFRSIWH